MYNEDPTLHDMFCNNSKVVHIIEEKSNIRKVRLHKNMDDHDNASLYIVIIKGSKFSSKVEKIKMK